MSPKPTTYSFPVPANDAKTAENESIIVVQNSDHDHAETDSIGSEIEQPPGPTDADKDPSELTDEPSASPPPALVDMPLTAPDKPPVFPTEGKDTSMTEKQVENETPEEDFHERSVAEETATRTVETEKQASGRFDNPARSAKEEISPTPSVLKDIVFQKVGNKIVAVIETSESVYKFNSFTLQSPSRIVIDLIGNWKNEGKKEYDINSNPVKKIRTGLYPEKLRIVIDMADDQLPRYAVEKTSRGLVVVANIGA